jgi:hypothetical protein
MPYASIGEIVDALSSFADETDTQNFTVPPSRRRRLGHYVQRATDEIWNYRPWSFKYTTATGINFYVGESAPQLPIRFGNIGDEGVLWNLSDNSREPWVEIALQDMIAVQAAGRDQNKKWFAVKWDSQPRASLLIPNLAAGPYGDFTLFYEQSPVTFDLDNIDIEEVPFPQIFHDVLFAGSMAKLQQAKGDPQSIWRAEYISALAKVTARFQTGSSRMQQMPNTVGGQW